MHPSSPDPQSAFATRVVLELRQAGADAYWAGGCVRDLLRKLRPQDYDVATSATPGAVRKLFGARRTLAVGESFGVIIVLPPEGLEPVEVATFRTEGPYKDGRRPDSVVYATAEEDALRRDFTINGMFYDPVEHRVLDFVGGQADLKAGIVRAIGDAHARMQEDKLRLLRAVRFTAVLDFQLDPGTAEAVKAMSSQLSVVSVERIAQELRKMLLHRNRRRAIELCLETGLMDVVLPGWTETEPAPEGALQALERLETPSFGLALAVLMRSLPNPEPNRRKAPVPTGTVRGHCHRLKLSTADSDSCLWLHAHQHDLDRISQFSDADLKRLLAHPLSGELLKWFSVQAAVDADKSRSLAFLTARSSTWTAADLAPPPLITGQDILALGLKPGPRLKELLEAIRTAQLNGEVATVEEAQSMLRALIGGSC
ncbi:tRNA nucleotidyltransferase/poly(A) polymerase [Caulifigura coniformis]|uniref:tRNA nucleotidyltransferase/poly(A) polymerase n=1 Tax=Caulifigura coniformis TaxID=2527983 RepID=A0A517SCI5_9PLAN|nr:CCA tRNA nucleotidyltransferase [Caulifigura coniformis]QDT53837.1 tRNA nucleotidyltransferase/poly(A) polymerase [Caulifigura coniformis]